MKSSNVQRLPEKFYDHTNMGAMVGLCVDDLIDSLDTQGLTASRITVEIVQKDRCKGDGTWTITATAETEKK